MSPPADTVVECTETELISGDMLRMNREGHYWHMERELNWDAKVATFDGKLAKMFYDEKSTGEMIGFIENRARNPESDCYLYAPVAIAFRPCESELGGHDLTGYTVRPGTETIDGRTCVVVTPGPCDDGSKTLWLDLERDFLPLRIQDRGPNGSTLEISYQKDKAHGWVPLEWTWISVGGTSRRLFGWTSAKVTAYSINADIPRSEFQFEFPVGTYVTDARAGNSEDLERYIVREGGKKRIITKDEIHRGQGVNYKELLNTESGKAGLGRDKVPKEPPDSAHQQEIKWTPENIKKDPTGYLQWAIKQNEATNSSLEASKVTLDEQSREVFDKLQKVSNDRLGYESLLTELKEAYRKADDSNNWPVAVRNQKFETSRDLKRRIVECNDSLENSMKLVETYSTAQRTITERLSEIDEKRATNETLHKRLTTELEAAKMRYVR
jgi:hypothetical protein